MPTYISAQPDTTLLVIPVDQKVTHNDGIWKIDIWACPVVAWKITESDHDNCEILKPITANPVPEGPVGVIYNNDSRVFAGGVIYSNTTAFSQTMCHELNLDGLSHARKAIEALPKKQTMSLLRKIEHRIGKIACMDEEEAKNAILEALIFGYVNNIFSNKDIGVTAPHA